MGTLGHHHVFVKEGSTGSLDEKDNGGETDSIPGFGVEGAVTALEEPHI